MAKLYFYYAAMNAGKSTTLLQADFNYRERGMETMLWTARLDERSGPGRIASRLDIGADAHSFEPATDLFAAVGAELNRRRLHCILVDEAQFLTEPQVHQLCRLADELDLPVLCYGLRTTSWASSFPAAPPCSRSPTRWWSSRPCANAGARRP
jgi:thymidine kinase